LISETIETAGFGYHVTDINLNGFGAAEEEMIREAMLALRSAGYDASQLLVLIRADLPAGYRGMSLPDGAVLGEEAFASAEMLRHVLEEELLHLVQKAQGRATEFGPGTARSLENEIDEQRKFPLPEH
jgi:hypothetical protein